MTALVHINDGRFRTAADILAFTSAAYRLRIAAIAAPLIGMALCGLFVLAAAPSWDPPANLAWTKNGRHAKHSESWGDAAPKIAPQAFIRVDEQTARQINAEIPFASMGPDRPLPFRIAPEAAEFARAVDCLASAVLFEAGDNRIGQAAVAQVVLNRVRHPAFPHSVCAVVYQGSERTSGCQFTFTCDGALHRMPSPAAWRRARWTASAFLLGETYPGVGMATHYHTDWVHPYWSAELDKIARIDTHLFFRWRGGWGRSSAFGVSYAGNEPLEPKLGFLSFAHRSPEKAQTPIADDNPEKPPAGEPSKSAILIPDEGDHYILVDAGGDGAALAMQSLGHCRGKSYCKVVGWDRRSQAYGSPQNPIARSVAFLYVTDKRTGVEIVLWDCARFNRPSDMQCLSDKTRRWIGFQGDFSRVS